MKSKEKAITPSISATEAIRRNYLNSLLKFATPEHQEAAHEVHYRKVMEGDHKAYKEYVAQLQAAAGIGQQTQSVNVRNSFNVDNGLAIDAIVEARRIVACLIAFTGPKAVEEIAQRLHYNGEFAMRVLQGEFFDNEGGKWHLTGAGRSELLEQPARIAAEVQE